jgi:NAD(P)H dehydrogenase (quinone)
MLTVTGATGKLGRLVIEGLLERVPADQIVAAVRNPEKATDFAERGVNVRLADYNEPHTLIPALEDTDRLLLISTNDPTHTLAQHTAVTDAAKQVGVGLLAYTSLVAPIGPYQSSEPIIRESGLPFTLLRNNQYAEHYAQFVKQALAIGVFVGSTGEGRVAAATRDDFAAAAVAVLTGEGHENKVYELNGDVAWSLPELVAEVSRATGKEIGYQNVSAEKHVEVLVTAGIPRPLANVWVAVYRAIAEGSFARTTPDLRDLIGRPTTTLAESVAAAING